MTFMKKSEIPAAESQATVHCPICTHTVSATVLVRGKNAYVKPGQKCARCSASLDAGRLLWLANAA
jgi:hypothetical protein